MRTNLRKIAVLSIPLLILAGCASEPTGPLNYAELSVGLDTQCESFQTGDAAEQITVLGDFGTQPEVSFPVPLTGTGIETAVIIEGDGGKILGGQQVLLHFAGFNAATGDALQASDFTSQDYAPQDLYPGLVPDFCSALTGVTVGSRVAVLLDAENAHGNVGIESLGIGASDGVIFVFDIIEAYLPRANGDAQPAKAGLPTVVSAPDGQPGIQIPSGDAPDEYMSAVLIEGGGEPVEIGDNVVLHYTGWTWEGEQFDSSWERQSPATFPITVDGLIEGFIMALDQVTVGSRVIAVIPPELGYGDSEQGSIPAGSTLIFVIDVLGK
jgi:FKBP-type peptidyl-prolyl cis-trans isomerase